MCGNKYHAAPVVIAVLAAWLLPAPAGGFVRSRDPEYGTCLWWKDRSVTYLVHEACSQDVPRATCLEAVRRSFEEWNKPACSDFNLIDAGTTARTDVGFDQKNWDDNINLVIWVESGWRHERSAIALTTTTYDTANGEIVDADIELNGENYTFSVAEPALTITDIQNTLVHEVGHLLGLDHSINRRSSMFAEASPGETEKRDLFQDDIDGLCFVYPADGSTPKYYLVGEETFPCAENPPGNGNGCGCTSRRGSGAQAFWAAGLLLLARVRRTRAKGEIP